MPNDSLRCASILFPQTTHTSAVRRGAARHCASDGSSEARELQRQIEYLGLDLQHNELELSAQREQNQQVRAKFGVLHLCVYTCLRAYLQTCGRIVGLNVRMHVHVCIFGVCADECTADAALSGGLCVAVC